MERINEELAAQKQRKYLFEKYSRRLEELTKEREREEENFHNLKTKFHKELQDAEQLERISLTKLFLMISGKKEERIAKEKKEAHKARLLYEESLRKLEDLDAKIQAIAAKVSEFGDAPDKLQSLLVMKEQMIHSTNPVLSKILYGLAQQKAQLTTLLQEISEAESAAFKAKEALENAKAVLENAKNWGYVDMAGGDFLATAIKRSYMDDARASLHTAQHYMEMLQAELSDLGKDLTTNLDISEFLSIADYFFDNIFSDYLVQDKITRSTSQVNKCLEKLEGLLLELGAEKERVNKEWLHKDELRTSYIQGDK